MSIKNFDKTVTADNTDTDLTDDQMREAAKRMAASKVDENTDVRGFTGRPTVGALRDLLNEPGMAEFFDAEISIEVSLGGGVAYLPAEIVTMEIAQHDETKEIRMIYTAEIDFNALYGGK